ncbi:MAG: hypothetical protein A2147_09060 [Chloroflexi bacterium RBG_16_57_8]|nr:MAG: hypothetical protein A2147_09060 [Chloroflexi bacterium RBG_16_57_8]
MDTIRYSEWDGSQDWANLDADDLMNELHKRLMDHGDLSQAMRMMQRGGFKGSQGQRMPGLQDFLQRLRQQRQSQLQKYKLGSMMDDIREKLDDILKSEREGIQKKLDEARQKAGEQGSPLSPDMQQKMLKRIEDMAAQNLQKLDGLPPDMGGQIKGLSQYDFMDAGARQKFQELMDMLKKNAMSSYAKDMMQSLKNMDPETMSNIRHMLEAMNQMLEDRLKGKEPDFDGFMRQFGGMFGPNPPRNLDELIERMAQQMAQAQSLLESLSAEDRQALQDMIGSMFDESTQLEMAKLAANLEQFFPMDELRRRYPFSGDESLSYNEAMKLMEEMQKMDRLQDQLNQAQRAFSLDGVDDELLKELLGDQASNELDNLRHIAKILEEAGYIQRKNGKWELTPRGMRRIGQKALQEIFAHLRKDRIGGHNLKKRGADGEKLEETKKFNFGDDFELDLQKTLMNSLRREHQELPIKLSVEDFEICQREATTRTATVLMIDLSLSMFMSGRLQAAKRTTIALDTLIRSQFPKDNLYIVGFSQRAGEIKKEDLPFVNWNGYEHGTNIQEALSLARKKLDKEQSGNKQIILISDGEPTAHIEAGQVYFQYPPSFRTLAMTMREVKRCTQKGIVINTFMLDESSYFSAFVVQMARLNKGRVFFANPDDLGKYVLVDYVSGKNKKIF